MAEDLKPFPPEPWKYYPLAALLTGLLTFVLGSLAILFYCSFYGIGIGLVLDLIALPLLLLTIHFGGEGLLCRHRGFARAGLVLALIPTLLTVLLFTSKDFAVALRELLSSL